MVTFKTLLCPVDFSPHSHRAFHYAAAVASWYRSALTVLHVVPGASSAIAGYGLILPPAPSLAETAEGRAALTDEVRRFIGAASPGESPVDIAIREGTATTEILNHAESIHADLVVIGTHGRSGITRLVLGSVAEKVLRQSPVPVLSVPPHADDPTPDAPVGFTRILCAVDFSECSMAALSHAASLARHAGATLVGLHVLTYALAEVPELYDAVHANERLTVEEFHRWCRENSRQRLSEAVEDATPGAAVVLAEGKPYREILRVADEQHCDLIVIGVRGRGAADLLFLGSTANHVIRQAACPVLTLRASTA